MQHFWGSLTGLLLIFGSIYVFYIYLPARTWLLSASVPPSTISKLQSVKIKVADFFCLKKPNSSRKPIKFFVTLLIAALQSVNIWKCQSRVYYGMIA